MSGNRSPQWTKFTPQGREDHRGFCALLAMPFSLCSLWLSGLFSQEIFLCLNPTFSSS